MINDFIFKIKYMIIEIQYIKMDICDYKIKMLIFQFMILNKYTKLNLNKNLLDKIKNKK